jgi:hypothetical protein
MKRYLTIYLAVLFFALLISGCSNVGQFLSANLTDVSLDEGNYEIVAKNVYGTAKASYLLGFSMSGGYASGTFALVRVSGTGMLYKEALEELWKNYEKDHGEVEGKKLALVNVRYDSDVLNLILYTELTIAIRADIVEFKD